MPFDMNALCAEMQGRINEIVTEWLTRVATDPYLQADDALTPTQIIDHVPQMLDELCELLSHRREPDFREVRASSHHGYIRAIEGYTLTELLRELELLRDCVFTCIDSCEAARGMSRAEAISTLRIVNEYFGEDIIFVVEHYLRRKNEATKTATI